MGDMVNDLDIKDAIVSREYELGAHGKAYIYLWRPIRQPTGEYGCPYLISGLGTEKIRLGFGVDSAQSLILTLSRIGAELYYSDAYKDGELTWCGDRNLGLPMLKSMREDFPDFD